MIKRPQQLNENEDMERKELSCQNTFPTISLSPIISWQIKWFSLLFNILI
jgi:hypothetical protein